ncbi:MAG: NAD-dependent epimerase/dehydratase family protein [Spirochaetes bacterium]|nr:NAD-dependent epimerase/dehydratase family protein [Spirochaetota bacterium]
MINRNKLKNLKIVVSGGAGFIGSHISEYLAASGAFVKIIDNLSTGKKANITHIKDKVDFIEGDIRDYELLKKEFQDMDYIFHEAAFVSVVESCEKPLLNNDINVTGMNNVLEAARINNVKKVIIASSAAVYGDEPTLPKEEGMKCAPISPYGVAKLFAEYYCKLYTDLYELPTVALRYFNVFGTRQDPGSPYSGVLSIFANLFKQQAWPELKIFGDGKQTRDFIFVKDVVQANMIAMLNDQANGQVFNIGKGISHSLLDIIKVMEQATGKEAKLCFQEARMGDIKYSAADISKIQKLGFEVDYSIEEGMKEYLENC